MDSIILVIIFIVLGTVVVLPIVNLYLAINTTLEVIIVKNKMKLKECKKIYKDMF